MLLFFKKSRRSPNLSPGEKSPPPIEVAPPWKKSENTKNYKIENSRKQPLILLGFQFSRFFIKKSMKIENPVVVWYEFIHKFSFFEHFLFFIFQKMKTCVILTKLLLGFQFSYLFNEKM